MSVDAVALEHEGPIDWRVLWLVPFAALWDVYGWPALHPTAPLWLQVALQVVGFFVAACRDFTAKVFATGLWLGLMVAYAVA